jgi:hypothetical protein
LEQVNLASDHSREVWLLPSGPAQALVEAASLPSNVRVLDAKCLARATEAFLSISSSNNPSIRVTATYDLPLKRSVALQLAQARSLKRIALLDDDIRISGEQIARATALLTPTHPLVGFHVFDFPDVSTLEHVHRLITSEPSYTIPGGNCLFLMPQFTRSFFPYVYNEDWLFLLYNLIAVPIVLAGTVQQDAHTPWHSLERVRFEEFGEIVIRGLLGRLHLDEHVSELDYDYWTNELDRRRDWLAGLLRDARAERFSSAIGAAMTSLTAITPFDCMDFVSALMQNMRNPPCLPNLIHELFQ